MRHILMLTMSCVVGANLGMMEELPGGGADSLPALSESLSSDSGQKSRDESTKSLMDLIAKLSEPMSRNNSKLENDCNALHNQLEDNVTMNDIKYVLVPVACLETLAINKKLTEEQKTNISELAKAAGDVINAYKSAPDQAMQELRYDLIRATLYAMANQSKKFTCIADIYSMLIKSIPKALSDIEQNSEGIFLMYKGEFVRPDHICDQINRESDDYNVAELEEIISYINQQHEEVRRIRIKFEKLSRMIKTKQYINKLFTNIDEQNNIDSYLINMFMVIIGRKAPILGLDIYKLIDTLKPHIFDTSDKRNPSLREQLIKSTASNVLKSIILIQNFAKGRDDIIT